MGYHKRIYTKAVLSGTLHKVLELERKYRPALRVKGKIRKRGGDTPKQ